MSSEISPGSSICGPTCHCTDAGTSALYWKTLSAGTPVVLNPVPSVVRLPLRKSCDVEIGGLPGIEKTVLPSGRS